jgi:carbamoylphosphate synthase large subunit
MWRRRCEMRKIKVKITYVNKFVNVVEKIIESKEALDAIVKTLEDVGVHYTLEDLQAKGYVRI